MTRFILIFQFSVLCAHYEHLIHTKIITNFIPGCVEHI